MAQIKSKVGENLILGGVERIVFVPYVDGVKGATGFALDDVVADTTAISQDEAETNAIDCETRDEPIYENVTLGSYNFTCESANIDKDVLEHALGFTVKGEGSTLKAYAPSSYRERWAEVEVQFQNGSSLVLPKIKLSSNIDASSLKTGIVRGIVGGTAYSTVVDGVETPFYVSGTHVNTVGGEASAEYYYKADSTAPTVNIGDSAATELTGWAKAGTNEIPTPTSGQKLYRADVVGGKVVSVITL